MESNISLIIPGLPTWDLLPRQRAGLRVHGAFDIEATVAMITAFLEKGK